MTQMGLDDHHRRKNGHINRMHGDTLVSTLRFIYGMSFAKGFDENAKLEDVLSKLDDLSLSQLVRHYDAGTLRDRINGAKLSLEGTAHPRP